MFAMVAGKVSSLKNDTSGVQGFVLGPFLFLICVNYIANFRACCCKATISSYITPPLQRIVYLKLVLDVFCI